MRYVFFSTGSWEGNASMVRLRELGRGMIARGVDVTYAVDDFEYNRKSLGVDPKANVVYTPAPQKVSATWRRRRVLRDPRPDFVHVLNPAPKSAAGLWGSRWRVVGDWDEWPMTRDFGLPRKLMERYLDWWLRNRAVLRVVASKYMQDEFRRRFGIETLYLPYAAYLPEHPPTTSPFPEPTFVYMGNFYPAYDHDLLFGAAVRLKARGRTPAILFMGHGPDLEKWRAFARDHGLSNVRIPGFVTGEELWRSLRHAHALLFPIRPVITNLARCPSKTFAYAQARRPVIANRVGEIPEVLGDNGIYVDVSADAFADAIEAHMGRDLGDVDYGVERHNWPARVDALMAALGRIGSGGPSTAGDHRLESGR
jgi:glycosyltransferase involved in cell wall biosynthesis